MRRLVVSGIAACLLGLGSAGLASAGGSPMAAAQACQDAVRSQARTRYPDSKAIEFSADQTQIQQRSDTETSLKGKGKLKDQRGNWSQFSYTCSYDAGSGKTRGVSFDLKPSSKLAKTDAAEAAVEACQAAATSRLRQKHPNADQVEYLNKKTQTQRQSKTVTNVSGEGEFQGKNGKWKSFTYQCSHDAQGGGARVKLDIP
jgi:hypothetical protein